MNRWTLTLVALLIPSLAHGQDWAKEKLAQSPRHGEWVKVKNGSREVETFVVYPESKEKATAVVVIHEIFGLADWVQLLADELAEAGYIAVAPDLLSGMAPKGGGTAELGSGARQAIGKLPPEQILADLSAAVAYAAKLPACDGKVVAAGFCWGGGQCFRFAAHNKDIKAAYVFYGGSPPKDVVTKVNCPVYGFYAENDMRVNATLADTEAAMKAAGKTFDRVIYAGGGHGFMRQGAMPNPREGDVKAREAAWKRWRELLKQV